MTRDKGRDAPDSHLDNLIPFSLADATAARLLAGAPARLAAEDIAAAWDLVRDIGIKDGEPALVLAIAIGCLCRALTPPTGGPAEGPAEGEDRS